MCQLPRTTHGRFRDFPARPKRAHGLLHRRPREQRSLIRQMGSQLFQQHQAEQRQAAQQQQRSQTAPSGHAVSQATTGQRAPMAAMGLPQQHVNLQDLTNPLLAPCQLSRPISNAPQSRWIGTRSGEKTPLADITQTTARKHQPVLSMSRRPRAHNWTIVPGMAGCDLPIPRFSPTMVAVRTLMDVGLLP